MMRVIVAALAVNGALARWSGQDMIKDLARDGVERRQSLSEHQKGYERNANNNEGNITDDQKRRLKSRILKERGRPAPDKAAQSSEMTTRGGGRAGGRAGGTDNKKKSVRKPVAETVVAAAERGRDGSSSLAGTLSASSWSDHVVRSSGGGGGGHDTKSGKGSPAATGTANNPQSSPTGQSTMASPTAPSSTSSSSRTSKTDKGAKGGKSRKIVPGICDKRLYIAFDQIRALGPNGPFGTIRTPEDVTDLCSFEAPEPDDDDFNFGCPFLFIPGLGFIEGEQEYVELLGEEPGEAFNSLVKYCQCQQGFDLGCDAKIPHGPPTSTTSYVTGDVLVNSYSEFIPSSTPEVRNDYCKIVGVWNGDFESDAVELSPDVQDCGCYWIGTAKDMVGQCPGVELGAFFEFPEEDSMMPTPVETEMPTPMATVGPTFEDGFEEGETFFPDEPWTLSNGDIFGARRTRRLDEEEESMDWAITMDEAFESESSIMSPDLSNDDFVPKWANATLAIDEDEFGTPGTLTFYVLPTLGDDDYLDVYLDGEHMGMIDPSDEWVMQEMEIPPGSHEFTLSYAYNPLELVDPDVGVAFADKFVFTPLDGTLIPTMMPTTYYPTYYLPTGIPTTMDSSAPTPVVTTTPPTAEA